MKWWIIMAILLMLLSHMVYAAEPAFVELVPPDNHPPWVGQRVVFAVDLVVEGRFSGSTVFDLPQTAGVILMKPEERPVLSMRTIDDTEYTVQRHEFALFCQKDGEITIPGFTVRCGSTKAYGQPTQAHTLGVPSLSVTARLPLDAKQGQVLVTTKSMDVRETWTPFPGKAKVGDAFERTITMRAADVPGMLLPRIPTPELPGVAVYVAPPLVIDRTERGEFTGIRTETLTYICETAGLVEIPSVPIRWWNPSKSAWEEETLPPVILKIAATVSQTKIAAGGTAVGFLRYWPLWLALAAAVGLLGWFIIQQRKFDSETLQFKACLEACRRGNAHGVYNAVTQWRAAAGLLLEPPPESVTKELRSLQQVTIGLGNAWNGAQLGTALKSWRREARRKTIRLQEVLPDLNPQG